MASNRLKAYRGRQLALSNAYNKRLAEQEILFQERAREQVVIDTKGATKLQMEKVLSLLSTTAETAREAGRLRMEKLVSKALQYVFGPDFQFEIEIDETGGKPDATFYVTSPGMNGQIVRNEPQNSRGGGINDIVAAALQVATMVVYNSPKIQGPIVLDEPGKHVSEDFVAKFGEFLAFISKTFNRQITMVTHQPYLAETADRTLYSQIVGGKTKIAESAPQKATAADEDDEEIIFEDDENPIEWDS